MSELDPKHTIVVYLVRAHPLDIPGEPHAFEWIHGNHSFSEDLEDLIGPFDPDHVALITDPLPGGEGWHTMLDGLLKDHVKIVVTHLAPLAPAQRQQLIGICAQVGAHLVTPSDAGRNMTPGDHRIAP